MRPEDSGPAFDAGEEALARRGRQLAAAAAALKAAAADAARTGNWAFDAVLDRLAATHAAAGELAGLVRLVEEMAFRSRLIALNVAVEAARNGSSEGGLTAAVAQLRALARQGAETAVALDEKTACLLRETAEGLQGAEASAAALGESLSAAAGLALALEAAVLPPARTAAAPVIPPAPVAAPAASRKRGASRPLARVKGRDDEGWNAL